MERQFDLIVIGTGAAGSPVAYSVSRRLNLKHSGFKVLVGENRGRILGAHLLGARAEETINLFALAIRTG